MADPLNALTVDLEDYFMASAFEPFVTKSDWDTRESRITRNTNRILTMLDEFHVKATFFVVGWVAERFPGLVSRVHERGHEIACHGYHHRLIYDMTPEEFRRDLSRAKRVLDAVTGDAVIGYRAPSFSLTEETEWALAILKEEGFLYDASILPASHARGGHSTADRYPHLLQGLVEFPMSTLRVLGKNFPFSGGGYLRLLPYGIIKHGIERNLQAGLPSVVYVHPWEFDPLQPRIQAPRFDTMKHYLNLHKTEGKLRRLLTDFDFVPAKDVLAALLPASTPAPVAIAV